MDVRTVRPRVASLIVVSLLIVAAFSAGAASKTVARTAGDSSQGIDSRGSWTIPFLDSLTGPLAPTGRILAWGAGRAEAEINAAGGIAGLESAGSLPTTSAT